MRLVSNLLFVILIICNKSYCQSKQYPLQNLLKDSIAVAVITPQNTLLFRLDNDLPFKANPQYLIKNGKEVFAFITGTGRLYKAIQNGDSIYFTRQDSTTHFGYNIGAFPFSYHNNIYNLGGYGLWRINGQLRVFNNKAHEWDIVPLNMEVPIIDDDNLIYYDLAAKKIYIGLYVKKDQAIKSNELEKISIYNCMVLDLQTGNWTTLGNLSTYLKNNLATTRIITSSPWGLLVTMGDKITLLDYKNNKRLTVDGNKDNFQNLYRQLTLGNVYFKDSTLYYGSNVDKTLESILFHNSDFIPTGEVVYTTSIWANNWLFPFIVISIVVIILAGLAYLFIFRKKQIAAVISNIAITNEPLNTLPPQQFFEERELLVLQLLIENSTKAKTISLEELNKVLGLTKKPVEVQKKQRSDVITSINKKYAFITRTDTVIIDRQRTEFDGRSFEYFIAYEKLDAAKGLL